MGAESADTTTEAPAPTKQQLRRQARLDRMFERTMTKYNLPLTADGQAKDILVKQSIYLRRTGRGLTASGSVLLGVGGGVVVGGLAIMGTGELYGVLLGATVGAGGLIMMAVGIPQLVVGLSVRETAKQRLSDLGVDPKIKTEDGLQMTFAMQPTFSHDGGGFQLALTF